MRISLDANVFVYAAAQDAGEKTSAAQAIVRRAALTDCVLPLQSLAEFFNVATRRGGLSPESAKARVTEWRAVFKIRAADEHSLDAAIDATREHRLSFWDAMLWATIRDAGCRVLLSEDFQDGRRLDGVTFLNPFAASNQDAVDAVLPKLPST